MQLSTLRRDLKVSQRETEDAQEFAQTLAGERDAVKQELELTEQRLDLVSKELSEKASINNMLVSQVQVCAGGVVCGLLAPTAAVVAAVLAKPSDSGNNCFQASIVVFY